MLRKLNHLFGLIFILFSLQTLHAAEITVRDFSKGSLQDIKQKREDQPFLLVFWSKDCRYCYREMNMLGRLQPKYPDLDIVLVSTDAELDDDMVKYFFKQTGIKLDEIWVFSEQPKKLFPYVDRNWSGELPKTLFHNSKHEYQSIVGEVKYQQIKTWLNYIRSEDS